MGHPPRRIRRRGTRMLRRAGTGRAGGGAGAGRAARARACQRRRGDRAGAPGGISRISMRRPGHRRISEVCRNSSDLLQETKPVGLQAAVILMCPLRRPSHCDAVAIRDKSSSVRSEGREKPHEVLKSRRTSWRKEGSRGRSHFLVALRHSCDERNRCDKRRSSR